MATINDVAERAGVSTKTVSRYLSGFKGVSKKTIKRIELAAEELEFFPSAAARALRGKPTGILSLIADKLTTEPLSVDIVKGIHDVCEKRGKLLLIGETNAHPETFTKLVERFRQQKTEAIVAATDGHKLIEITQSFERCPLVLVNCFDKEKKYPAIVPDDRQGARDLTSYLISNGHRNIANIMLPEELIATQLRRKGFEQAMKQANIKINPKWVIGATNRPPADYMKWLRAVLENMLAPKKRPTAIMCGNDKMAFRVMMLLRAMHIDIPEDVSVLGHDDFKLISENTVPALTAVSLPYYNMGKRAAEMALDMAENNTRPQGIQRLHCEVVKRDSDRVIRRRGTATSKAVTAKTNK